MSPRPRSLQKLLTRWLLEKEPVTLLLANPVLLCRPANLSMARQEQAVHLEQQKCLASLWPRH